MSDLVVLGFDGLHAADAVLNKLRSLQKLRAALGKVVDPKEGA